MVFSETNRNMFSMSLLGFRNTRESLGELKKAVETLACWLVLPLHSILECTLGHFKQVVVNSWCFVGKQTTLTNNLILWIDTQYLSSISCMFFGWTFLSPWRVNYNIMQLSVPEAKFSKQKEREDQPSNLLWEGRGSIDIFWNHKMCRRCN